MQLYRVTLSPLITTAVIQDLSKQLLTMSGIKEQAQDVKPITSEPIAQSIPGKVQTDVETVKQGAPARVPEARKTAEAIKETKPQQVIALTGEGKRDILVYRIPVSYTHLTLPTNREV